MATSTDQLAGLPAADHFKDIEVPEFPRKYVKRQGPASTKGGKQTGRTFSASGPKANLIAQMIFADMHLTRTQMASIAKCSPSRVSEVIWALEDAVRKGTIESFPEVPTKPPVDEQDDDELEDEDVEDEDIVEDEDEDDDEDNRQRQPSELAEEIVAIIEERG
jgi:hypothetical protein